ncbi:hypothetical protein [Oceanobacillus manasiensis]|uniref:hypothetical protein n=1 Tax=Oceanobacillus manasiensis TaxID=586413 RepID=UPI0005AA111F|nr:hypothetical protein [Oceanobacillus manasiensis]
MKNFLLYPFRIVLQEIKKDKELLKTSKDSGSNLNLYPFITMSYMFLFVFSCMYLSILYLIIVGLTVAPIGLLVVIPSILTTWIFTLLYKKVYPKTKANYLKSIGFDNNNEM